jgi:hypothetical protein
VANDGVYNIVNFSFRGEPADTEANRAVSHFIISAKGTKDV